MQKSRSIIDANSSHLNVKELWKYRELFYFFAWRDIKVRYKQTYLGILWVLIQPIALLLLLTIIFSRSFTGYQASLPYPVFILSGLLIWNLFYNAVSNGADSMIQHTNIIRKIYFPRLVIPGSSLFVALFDFFISMAVFIGYCIAYKVHVDVSMIYMFPLAVLLVMAGSFGLSLFLSAFNIKYRDFRYALPFMLQFLFFASQIVFPIDRINNKILHSILAINPVNGAIEIFRYPLTGNYDPFVVWISAISSVILTVIGLYYFRKSESFFADLA